MKPRQPFRHLSLPEMAELMHQPSPPAPPPPPEEVPIAPIERYPSKEAAVEALNLPTSFSSTHGKHVPGNDFGYARVKPHREYRQYMNRRGGFNRPLAPESGHKQRID